MKDDEMIKIIIELSRDVKLLSTFMSRLGLRLHNNCNAKDLTLEFNGNSSTHKIEISWQSKLTEVD